MNLVALEFVTKEDFSENLEHLLFLIKQSKEGDVVVAPEVCLTGFCYERMDEACAFAKKANEALCRITDHKQLTVCLSMIVQGKKGYENKAIVFSCGAVVYERAKIKLFPLGEEDHYFEQGEEKSLVFEIAGKRFGLLVCFELRFIQMWSQMEDVDGVIVMAMWGKNRASHFITLCDALALTKQAYVIASSSCNDDMAGHSSVIDAWGRREMMINERSCRVFDEKVTSLTRRQIAL